VYICCVCVYIYIYIYTHTHSIYTQHTCIHTNIHTYIHREEDGRKRSAAESAARRNFGHVIQGESAQVCIYAYICMYVCALRSLAGRKSGHAVQGESAHVCMYVTYTHAHTDIA
jgi:hypothetical protein